MISIGQDLPALVVDEAHTDGEVFTVRNWIALLDSMFFYFDINKVPPATWDKLGQAQRIILEQYAETSWTGYAPEGRLLSPEEDGARSV